MNDLEKYDEIMLLLDEAVKKIDNNDLNQADKYLEKARNKMKDMRINEQKSS